MERWFTKGFRERAPQAIARMTEMFLATKLDGYIACVRSRPRHGLSRASNPRITAPTLVIVGRHDPATPPAAGESIAQAASTAPSWRRSTPRIFPMSSSRRPITETVLNFLPS